MNKFFKFDYVMPIGNWWYPFHYETEPKKEELNITKENGFFKKLDVNSKNRSLYFHIPFCEGNICNFCNLPKKVYKNKTEIDEYVDALIKEIKYKSKFKSITKQPIKSIFFGGGSPSVLSVEHIEKIGSLIHEKFNLSELNEFSFEMNAKGVTEEKIIALKKIGVTHGRIGVQTFSSEYREIFGLSAKYKDIKNGIEILKKHLKYTSIDLIYGMHGQTVDDLIRDINMAIELSPDLIDYYPITNFLTQKKLAKITIDKKLHRSTGLTKIGFNIIIKEIFKHNNYIPHNGHSFIKTKSNDKFMTRDYSFIYHKSVYGLRADDIIGFGAFANSQLEGYIISNPDIQSYVNGMKQDSLPIHYVSYNAEILDEKGLIAHLPYFGYILKKDIKINTISKLLLDKLNYLKGENLIIENELEYSLTKLGWYWYVNIFYYLMPPIDQTEIDNFINSGNPEISILEKWKDLPLYVNDLKEMI